MNCSVASLWPGAEGLGPFLVDHWLSLAVVAPMLLVLLWPAALRAGRAAPRLRAAADRVANLFHLPPRLLDATRAPGAGMQVNRLVAGAVLLVVLLLNVPFKAEAAPRLVVTPPPVSAPAGVDVRAAWPPIVLVGAALAALLARIALRGRPVNVAAISAVAGIVGAAALVLGSSGPGRADWHNLLGLVRLDPCRAAAQVAVLAVGLVTLLAGLPAVRGMRLRGADFIAAALLSLAGMTVAVAATDFATLFAALVLMVGCNTLMIRIDTGIPTWDGGMRDLLVRNTLVLRMQADRPPATRVARTYPLAALVAGGVFLLGIALLCGAAGGTQFDAVRDGLAASLGAGGGATALVRIGLALTLAGLAFLVGAAPLGLHVPGVYAGAPVPAVGFMAVAPVVTALLVLFGLVEGPLEPLASVIRWALLLLGAASIVVGALASWAQRGVGRALGHLAACLVGMVLVAMAETAAPLAGARWAALSLVLMVVMLLSAGVLAAVACGGWREAVGFPWAATRRKAIRWAVPMGLAVLLGLLSLYGGVLMVMRSGQVGGETVRRILLIASAVGLGVAGARWLVMACFFKIQMGDGLSDATRFAAAGVFLVVLAVVTSPLWFIDAVARAIELTWL